MRTMQSKSGEQLYKAVTLKVFSPKNEKHFTRVVRAPKGQGLTSEAIERVLIKAATQIEEKYPTEEYSLVPIGPCAFNFVWRGPKAEELT